MKDILIAFVHVFAMMAPWLVFDFLMAGIIVGTILCGVAINLIPNALPASAAVAATGHTLSVVRIPMPMCARRLLDISPYFRHSSGAQFTPVAMSRFR